MVGLCRVQPSPGGTSASSTKRVGGARQSRARQEQRAATSVVVCSRRRHGPVARLLAQKLLVVPESSHRKEQARAAKKSSLPDPEEDGWCTGLSRRRLTASTDNVSEKPPQITSNTCAPSYHVPEAAEVSSASSSALGTPHNKNEAKALTAPLAPWQNAEKLRPGGRSCPSLG